MFRNGEPSRVPGVRVIRGKLLHQMGFFSGVRWIVDAVFGFLVSFAFEF